MSAEFSAFRRQLPGGGYGAPVDALGPVSPLEELLGATRRGDINKADASSLEQDLRKALDQLGSRVRGASRPQVGVFLATLGDLRDRIRDPSAGATLQSEVRLMLSRLEGGDLRSAALEDASACFLRPERSPERCELRLLALRELIEHSGYDWAHICARLDAVLEDHRSTIAAIDPAVSTEGEELAGLKEHERLSLCAQLVGREAERRDFAVWFVIDHEAIEAPWLALGPVQIFSGELWPEGLLVGGRLEKFIDDFVPPPELADDSGLRPPTDRVDLGKVLLARVWVGDVPRGGAPARARSILEGLIELAHPESSWRLYRGEMVWSEGGGWFGSSLLSPDQAAALEGPRHPVFERTAEHLQDLDPAMIEKLARGEQATRSAVEEALLDLGAAHHRTPELRVALGTRALERILPAVSPGEQSWLEPGREFLRPAWVKHSLYDELFDTALGGLEVAKFGLDSERREEYKRIHDLVMVPVAPGRREFAPAGFAAAVDDLGRFIGDPGTIAVRLIGEAAALVSSPPAALRRIAELERRFERLLLRSERLRNAIIHGQRPPAGLLANVDAFLGTLGAYATRDVFEFTASEGSAELPLERQRVAYEAAKEELAAGAQLIEALFPEAAAAEEPQ